MALTDQLLYVIQENGENPKGENAMSTQTRSRKKNNPMKQGRKSGLSSIGEILKHMTFSERALALIAVAKRHCKRPPAAGGP